MSPRRCGPPRHGRSRRRHRHRGPPMAAVFRKRWRVARGIHRRLLSILFVAVGMGGTAGWVLRSISGYSLLATLGVLGLTLLLLWPLTAVATFRIVRPIRELARVAGALREGELSRREELPENPSDDEVGQVADALHDMAERVAGQLEDQRALMAAVSHELRSPLGRIRVLVELAREDLAPDDLHDALQAEIDGMDALVGDLLASSRIDFEAIHPLDQSVEALARRALELTAVSESVLELQTDREVRADPTLLARALRVMLDNAVRYGGRVATLRVRQHEGFIRFEVDDEGPGFREGEETQAFEPFWRRAPQPGEPSPSGVGLGLALVKRIAEAHGGSAGAFNRPECGATVWIAMPAAEA